MFLNSQSGLIYKAIEKECGIYLRGIMIINTICDCKCLQKLTKFACEFIIYKSVEGSCANAKHCTITILQYIFLPVISVLVNCWQKHKSRMTTHNIMLYGKHLA